MGSKLFYIIGLILFFYQLNSQTQITNGGFENWGGNAAPGVAAEPTNWYSNKSGSTTAQLGPQTCSQETSGVHGGLSCARIESKTVPVIGTVVNGNLTTGVINAPSTNKADGYIGTVNFSSATDVRKMSFTGQPDSLVGWYKYTAGGANETGKVTAILHTGDYFDPETPTTHHPDLSANKIARALFFTPTGNATTWKRFSVPFVYSSLAVPTHIMVNITSSSNQTTNVAGSILWIDDLEAIYNPTPTSVNKLDKKNIKVYYAQSTLFVDFLDKTEQLVAFQIFDLNGKVIFSKNIETSKLNAIQLPSTLSKGMYLYQLSNASVFKTDKFFID